MCQVVATTTVYFKEKCIAEMTIVLLWFNKIFGVWTLTMQTTLISVLIIDMTIVILNQSVRALLAAVTTGTIMMSLYTAMGKVYEESKGIPKAWLVSCNDPWLKKRCIAYRTLRLHVGPFYYADRGLTITMLSTVLQNTANLVLGLRQR